SENGRDPYDERREMDPEIVVYRITGAFFFGAAASIGAVLDRIQDTHRALIIDLAQVPFLDSTGANTIDSLARKAERRSVHLYLTGTSHEMRRELFAHGLKPPLAHYAPDISGALQRARSALAETSAPEGESA
ncbi:MAG TPA: sodium-independent anion transporter, partial [Paracoccaceae bacterium]|nr:sodium-independent anion transporter [Paracoccaceae bacterium]